MRADEVLVRLVQRDLRLPSDHRIELAGSIAEQLRCRTAPPALSVAARVWNAAGEHVGHLALMNLHPVGFSTTAQVRSAVDRVTDGMPGCPLSSGRYFRYYGTLLLDSEAWVGFLAQFLGFCALRLNAVPPHKPVVPEQVVI